VEQNLPHGPLGLYIHIPWCLTRCPYCAFFALPFSREKFERYLLLLNREKQLYLPKIDRPLLSVYFGGGTPSLLSAAQINEILEGLLLQDDAEITLEINPIQVTPQYVKELKSTRVNRLSLGLQSLDDQELIWLGRKHKAADIEPRIKLLQDNGFTNISVDFIYGLPHSTKDGVEANLENILKLPMQHLSCYLLEIYDDSPLKQFITEIPEDEVLADQYHLILRMAESAGFRQYEISNFARPDYQSRHNLLYWNRDDYLALGAGASGYYQRKKYQNHPDLELYEKDLLAGLLFPNGHHNSSRDDAGDYVMMRLRLIEGIRFADYKKRFGMEFGREQAIAKLQDGGLLIADSEGISISPLGLFVSNYVISELL
jgi:oxygen-independent coproporphyrinogen III oxidase